MIVWASDGLQNSGLHYWPTFLPDVAFLHETDADADLLRCWKDGGDENFLVRRARVRDGSAGARGLR